VAGTRNRMMSVDKISLREVNQRREDGRSRDRWRDGFPGLFAIDLQIWRETPHVGLGE
jgi:hypothetical protein